MGLQRVIVDESQHRAPAHVWVTALYWQLTAALETLSAQYERERTQHAEQIAALQRQVEHFGGQVRRLITDYRTLAETLRGRWS